MFTCALATAVAFKILSLRDYILLETMVPLAETGLKIIFLEYVAVTLHCSGCQECQQIFVPAGHFFKFWK
jgi:hypothetical protein